MKPTRAALEQLNDRLSTENEALTLALSDLCKDAVKWFGNSRTYSLGVSRPTGAAGGVAIVRECGMASAYYFETYARDTLAHIASVITGTNSDYNQELLRRRATIEAAQAYVSEQQKAA